MDRAERTTFTNFPPIAGTDTMNETSFFKWLEENPEDVFVQALFKYMSGYGFDVMLFILPEEQVKNHKTTFEFFWYRRLGSWPVRIGE
jgi:hypothetical protein